MLMGTDAFSAMYRAVGKTWYIIYILEHHK